MCLLHINNKIPQLDGHRSHYKNNSICRENEPRRSTRGGILSNHIWVHFKRFCQHMSHINTDWPGLKIIHYYCMSRTSKIWMICFSKETSDTCWKWFAEGKFDWTESDVVTRNTSNQSRSEFCCHLPASVGIAKTSGPRRRKAGRTDRDCVKKYCATAAGKSAFGWHWSV